MTHLRKIATIARPQTLAIYGAAIAVAIGAAALGSAAFAPRSEEPSLVVSFGARPATAPDRIAGVIEPATPIVSISAREALPASPVAPQPAAQAASTPPIPPKPQPRPCLECVPRKLAVIPAEPAAEIAAIDEAPVVLASAEPDGPVPPVDVGAGEGARSGIIMRGGQAVVDGSVALVGSAWSLSGAAVDGLVRGVRQVSF